MATRMNGIISGLDTEALVKAQVAHQQAQIDRLGQNTQLITWQRDRYTDVYKKVEEFRNSVFNYRLSGATMVKSAASSSDSALSVKANAEAVVGTHTLKIHSMAKGAQTGSSAALGSSSDKKSIAKQFLDASNNSIYSGTFDIQVNGKTVTVDTSRSMNDLAKQINNSGAGVSASYDSNTDRFFISSSTTGEAAKVDFTGTTGTGLSFLKDTLKLPSSNGTDLDVIKGADAVFDLDGITGLKQAGNEFTISGITYNLKEADPSKELTITIKNDNEAALTSIKKFVEEYNNMLDSINSTIYEKKQTSFKPLTDEQKKAMTADQIKEWETNAKKGILRSDPLLSRIASELRTSIYTPVKGIAGKYNSLYAAGIGSTDYSSNGKLVIDEDKLKEALEADPTAVSQLFTGTTSANGQANQGVAAKLYDQLKDGMDKINEKAGSARGDKDLVSTLSKKITANNKAMNTKITRMNKQMQTYYKQYDAMEKLLQQLQSQQDSLTNYFNGGR